MSSLPRCRFHLAPVPALVSDIIGAALQKELDAGGFRMVRLLSPDALRDLPKGVGPCLLELLEAQRPQSLLLHLALDRPELDMIAIASDAYGGLAAKAAISPDVRFLSWPMEAKRLVPTILDARFRRWISDLEGQIDRAESGRAHPRGRADHSSSSTPSAGRS